MSYWLYNEYARWTADPDDPEVKRRKKTKPPPLPLVPPVAHRPPSVAAEYEQQFAGLVERFGTPSAVADPTRPVKRAATSAEFDLAIEGL